MAQVKDLHILSTDGYSLPLRVFTPLNGGPFPVILWYHGGGFVMGGLNSHTYAQCQLTLPQALVTAEVTAIAVYRQTTPTCISQSNPSIHEPYLPGAVLPGAVLLCIPSPLACMLMSDVPCAGTWLPT